MMDQKVVERLFQTQAAAVRMMSNHMDEFTQRGYDAAITRVFAFGEILEYTDGEIATEMALEMSAETEAKLAVDKRDLMNEVERLSKPEDDAMDNI